MSIFLAICLALLLIGAAITYIFAIRRTEQASAVALVIMTILLVIWLIASRLLPQNLTLASISYVDIQFSLSLHIDGTAWQLSLYLLLLVEALLLISTSVAEVNGSNYDKPINQRLIIPSILALTGTALLSLWSESIPILLISWTLLALFWSVFLWSIAGERISADRIVIQASPLLFGVFFLWLAVAFNPGSKELSLNHGEWPIQSQVWAFIAAVAQLGVIPLHWWRPINWRLPTSKSALIHIVPAVAGGSLLVRLISINDSWIGITLLATIIGLIGILVGTVLTWRHFDDVFRALAGLALAQASLLALLGVWTSAGVVVAGIQVLVLAIGGLFLVAELTPPKLNWFPILPVAALAGLPLTSGFVGLVQLYGAWIVSGRIVLVLATGLLYVPLIASAILLSVNSTREQTQKPISVSTQISHNTAMLLPTIGLLALPSLPSSGVEILSLIIILTAAILGLILSRKDQLVQEARPGLRRAIRLNFPTESLRKLLTSKTNALGNALREALSILEGEGGLLWLLVLVIIFWLAQRG